MMMPSKNKFLALVLLLGCTPIFASEIPFDWIQFSDPIQTQGPVSVKRGFQFAQATDLVISYYGDLREAPALTALVIVHYSEGTRSVRFKMVRIQIAGEKPFHQVRITNGCLVGMLGGCKTWAPDDMKTLLYWANRGGAIPGLNALELEVALDAGGGVWDSNSNHLNYHFYFSEHLRN